MFNLKTTIGAAIVLATMGTANAASLVLDSFNYDPAISLDVNSTGVGAQWHDTTGPLANVDSPNNGTLIADLLLQNDNGNPGTNAAASSFINGASGELSYSNDTGVESEMSLFYTDIAPGALPVDFTFGGVFSEFYFDVSAIDTNFLATIYVISGAYDYAQFINAPLVGQDNYTYNTAYLDGLQSSTVNLSASTEIQYGDPVERLTAGFSDLVGTADITSVTGVFAIFSSTGDALDVTINEIGLTSVPEPTSLAILGLGLLGFCASRRKA